ncbi:MAG: FAD-binding oxidoreductase [Actinomycetota bacterium]|nr:FAD-binding oxidoreductase [Actinomycetota bacterium]
MRRIDRHEFLARSAKTALVVGAASQLGWLSACGPTESSGPSLRSFAESLEGPVFVPGDAGYREASQLFNPRFDDIRPQVIAFCESPDDVRKAIAWSREQEMPIVARCGGHSYGGYSSVEGLVADVTRMNRIDVDPSEGTAAIGAGSYLSNVYAALAGHNVAIPAGTCPTVGISGLTLGGGIGMSSRKLGLTADNLLEVELVTASGEVVTASERERPELFWACRGGGSGNFGIATGFKFRVHPVGDVAIYDFRWSWEDARAVFDAWQRFAPHAPDELSPVCTLAKAAADPGRNDPEPFVSSSGQYFGSQSELRSLLEPLLSAGTPTQQTLTTMSFLDAQKHWAGGDPSRSPHKAKSDYVAEPFSDRAIETMIRWVEDWPGSSNPQGGAIQIEAYGGAINRVPEDATSFIHRGDLFSCQYLAYWDQGDPQRVADANLAWIAGFYDEMRPFVSGFAYQNNIDPDLAGWERAYYGSALERLMDVKATYDPDDVFHSAQSIPLSRT